MDQLGLYEFAKTSENKETDSFNQQIQEAGIPQGDLIVSKLYNTMLGSITRTMLSWQQELLTILNDSGISPSSLTNEQVFNAIKVMIKNYASGIQIGDLIPNIGTVAPPGRMLCDGSTINNCRSLFPEFYEFVTTKTPYITLAAYSAQLDTYGQCGYCAVSGDNVRLPKITRPISGVSNISQTGQAIRDSLGNHVHGFGYNSYNNNGTFIFSEQLKRVVLRFKKLITWNGSGSTHEVQTADTLDANMLTSEPFDTNTETRGKQVQYPYCIQVYNTATDQSFVNVSELVALVKEQAQLGIKSLPASSGVIQLNSGGIYQGEITGAVSFVLPTVYDPTNLNQILVQLKIGSGGSVTSWGTINYITEEPADSEGSYNVIYEYDVPSAKWFVGQLIKVS